MKIINNWVLTVVFLHIKLSYHPEDVISLQKHIPVFYPFYTTVINTYMTFCQLELLFIHLSLHLMYVTAPMKSFCEIQLVMLLRN